MKKLMVLLIAVVLYVWDDILFGAPIALLAGVVGVLSAFLVSTVVVGGASYALTKLFIIDNKGIRKNTKLARFINRGVEKSHGKLANNVLSIGRFTGVFLSSWLGGGILTTYLLKSGDYQGDLEKAAIVSNVIFAIMFSAQYSGIGWILKELVTNFT